MNYEEYVSMMGYRNNSPFKDSEYLYINTPTGLIDMSKTDIDLLGVDNKGNKKIMKAGTKIPYKFEGDTVKEIPIKKYGGTTKNNDMKRKSKKYQIGGKAHESLTDPSQRVDNDGNLMPGGWYQPVGYIGSYDFKGKTNYDPNSKEWMINMIHYMRNNGPESNVYRPKYQHHSVEVNNINKDQAQNGGNFNWLDTNQSINSTPTQPARYRKDANGNLVDVFTGEIVQAYDQNQMSQERVDASSTTNTLEYTPKNDGQLDMSKGFKIANGIIDGATGIANIINNNNTNKLEKRKYLDFIQPKAKKNYDEDGLNNIPTYFQNGGQSARPILAEAGEVFQDTQGGINKISDHSDTHDDASGGVQVHGVSKVLEDTGDKREDIDSKLLLIQPNEMMDMTGIKVKKALTHSKAYEILSKKADKDAKHVEKYLKRNVKSIEDSSNDLFAKNSLNLNTNALNLIPTKNDIFQTLFEHQENKKAMYRIDNAGEEAQNGLDNSPESKKLKYLKQQAARQALDNDVDNSNINYEAAYKDYLQKISRAALENEPDYSNDPTNPLYGEDYFNSAGYNTVFPKGITGYDNAGTVPVVQHSRGNGNYGTQDWDMNDFYSRHPFVKEQRPNFDPSNPEDVKWFQNNYNKRSEEYFGIPYFNGQGHRKVDGMFGQGTWSTPDVTPLATQPSGAPQNNPTTPDQARRLNFTNNPKNGFNAPLKWYDTLPATTAFIDGLNRRGVNYDGVTLNEPKVKYQNPLPALQEGQRAYNAALETLPQNGVGFANQANLFGKKYSMDAQVMGNYENINNGIWNNYQDKITTVRNDQANADFQARQMFERKQLQSLEAQRQQLFQSMKDLTGTIAQNAKYNREGNLLMKLFPNFNQEGDFNGRRYNFTSPNPFATPQPQINPKKRKTNSNNQK